MKRIQAAVDELGYQPNQAARVLKGQQSRLIGLILPELADPFYSVCAGAIEQVAYERGYATLILAARPGEEGLRREVDLLISP